MQRDVWTWVTTKGPDLTEGGSWNSRGDLCWYLWFLFSLGWGGQKGLVYATSWDHIGSKDHNVVGNLPIWVACTITWGDSDYLAQAADHKCVVSVVLPQLWSVFMSLLMADVATRAHKNAPTLDHNLLSCWRLRDVLLLVPAQFGWPGLSTEVMVSSGPELWTRAMSASVSLLHSGSEASETIKYCIISGGSRMTPGVMLVWEGHIAVGAMLILKDCIATRDHGVLELLPRTKSVFVVLP